MSLSEIVGDPCDIQDDATRRMDKHDKLHADLCGPDIQIYNDGSVCLFTMLTDVARHWVEEHVQLDGWQFMGANSFAVDHRYAGDLADGMINDGLTVE